MQFMADVELRCEHCGGKRFGEEVLEVRYKGKTISDVLEMSVDDAVEFFSQEQAAINQRIVATLKTLQDVGLGYIKLGQSTSTLSGGEIQRVKLASYLMGEDTTDGTMFIFDEPTTGLHFHDISKLLSAFDALLKKGHTIVIIEHNLDVIKCADWVIDLGAEAGVGGGNLVYEGTPEGLMECKESYTGSYLRARLNGDK
jgi:excinuclease ABC subunit A